MMADLAMIMVSTREAPARPALVLISSTQTLQLHKFKRPAGSRHQKILTKNILQITKEVRPEEAYKSDQLVTLLL